MLPDKVCNAEHGHFKGASGLSLSWAFPSTFVHIVRKLSKCFSPFCHEQLLFSFLSGSFYTAQTEIERKGKHSEDWHKYCYSWSSRSRFMQVRDKSTVEIQLQIDGEMSINSVLLVGSLPERCLSSDRLGGVLEALELAQACICFQSVMVAV